MEQVGDLQVDFRLRLVLQDGEVRKIGARAFDILQLLIQAQGALVTKDEIMRVVWPRVIVEENNVQVQLTALRRLLGPRRDLLKTEAGRGYRLVSATQTGGDYPGSRKLLPQGLNRLFGRDEALEAIHGYLSESRLVTLAGPGGIGKTSLAVEAARLCANRFRDDTIFVDLSTVTDERFTINAVASAAASAGLPKCLTTTSLERLREILKGQSRLIVLDNCEHVLNEAATIATAIIETGCSILATSREPLRIRNERIFSVPPLHVPAKESTVDQMTRSNVVLFFAARTQAVQPGFEVTETNVTVICQICRALDGLPLAIELAAARAAVLGIEVVADNLDDRMRVLTGGHRASLPRHQTIRATLDWSYRLLDSAERALFRRLGIFVGQFSYEAGRHVMNQFAGAILPMLDALQGLISKSLVVAVKEGRHGQFRLLETTRQYALMQLDANGERETAARAHAGYLISVFSHERSRWNERTDKQQLEMFSNELDNIRAVLDWALSDNGDPDIGLTLAALTLPYLFELSLVTECRDRAEKVLKACEMLESNASRARMLLAVSASLGSSIVYVEGPVEQTVELWHSVHREATKQRDSSLQARSLWGVWNARQYGGEPLIALDFAEQFYELALENNDATRILLGMRIRAISLHYLGQHESARAMLESMLRQYDPAIHRWETIGFRIDQRTVAQATLARILWSLGETKRSQHLAEDTLQAAIAYGNQMVLCYVLVETIPLLCTFDACTNKSYTYLDLLESTSRQMSFRIWSVASEAYSCCMRANKAPTASSLASADLAIAGLTDVGYMAPWCFLNAKLAIAYLKYGDEPKADDCVTRAIERCEASGEKWFYPELCRVKARALLNRSPGTALLWLAKGWDAARTQRARQMEANIRDEIAVLVGIKDERGREPAWESSLILAGRLAIPSTSAVVVNSDASFLS